VDDAVAGRNGKCKSCGKIVTVPESGAGLPLSPSDVIQNPRPALPIRSHLSAPIQPFRPIKKNAEEEFPARSSPAIQPLPIPVAVSVNHQEPVKSSHSLGIAALILGILAFLICWIPLIGLLGLPLSCLGLLVGMAGIILAVCRKGSGLGFSIAGSAICALAMCVTIGMSYAILAPAIDKVGKASQKMHAANQAKLNLNQDGDAAKAGGLMEDARPQEVALEPIVNPMQAGEVAKAGGQPEDLLPQKGAQKPNVNPKLEGGLGKAVGELGAAPPPQEAPKPKDEWADAGNEVQQGDICIRVKSAKVDFVGLTGYGGRETGASQEKFLQIALMIENRGDSVKINYEGWGGRAFGGASVKDDLGNSYRGINFGFANKVVGQIKDESVYPGKIISDVLVFEEPIKKAKFLKLELPASALGGTGILRIKIPIEKN